MSYSAKRLINILILHGYIFKRANGSHHLYFHPDKNITVIVPVHGKKDLPKGTFYTILKQAGIYL